MVYITLGRSLVRFNGGNSDGLCSGEISESGRFVGLGVAGGDDKSVDGGDEKRCGRFLRLCEPYVCWTVVDMGGRLGASPSVVRRRDAFIWLCLNSYLSM